ncbi:MAG: 4Fe-4S ferredoxin [bacterium P3]|nr:MAG: 4Fe-4S ferredoxin [bacterium P3]KWW42201.1 MAG: 4Fe-4S ferredoxin [bacterium F083]
MILHFSGCGNSRFVAQELAAIVGDTAQPLLNTATAEPLPLDGAALGIVCPVYAWAVPRVVEEHLRRVAFTGTPAYCYLVCTCGDSVGRTPERFARSLRRIGLHLDAAFGFVMPETYINLPGFHLDSPESETRKLDAVRRRLPQVARQIQRHEHIVDVRRGAVPRLTTYLVNPLFYRLFITDRKFHVSDSCTGCGHCADQCPLHNISLDDGRPRWHGHCTNCMACYHHCPEGAIQFGRATQGKGQYYFGHSSEKKVHSRCF